MLPHYFWRLLCGFQYVKFSYEKLKTIAGIIFDKHWKSKMAPSYSILSVVDLHEKF